MSPALDGVAAGVAHTARVLAGPPAAQALLDTARERAARLPQPPELHLVRVGEDPASRSYVRLKEKKAREVGIAGMVHALPQETSQAELLALIARLNADSSVSGILVQLPLPEHLSVGPVLEAVDPRKDVDGFHPVNVGRLWSQGGSGVSESELLPPCTPAGVLALLDFYGVALEGVRAVVVGRSSIVGRPLAGLLLARHATVTVAHSRTPQLAELTREAELLVVAAGRPGLITPQMVKPGAVVVDVGVNRVEGPDGQSRLVGDVDPAVSGVAAALTPVPGGVGPMTVAQLMLNTVRAAEHAAERGRAER